MGAVDGGSKRGMWKEWGAKNHPLQVNFACDTFLRLRQNVCFIYLFNNCIIKCIFSRVPWEGALAPIALRTATVPITASLWQFGWEVVEGYTNDIIHYVTQHPDLKKGVFQPFLACHRLKLIIFHSYVRLLT